MHDPEIKLVAFDMDGTLFNSFSVSYDAVREGFERFWHEVGAPGPIPTWAQVKHLIGMPSYEFYPSMLPDSHREQWKLLHRHIGDAEELRLRDGKGKCFDGTHDALQELLDSGYRLGVLTNASKGYMDAVLDGCDLRRFFHLAEHLGERLSLNKNIVLGQWAEEYESARCVAYAGDRNGDIESAQAAGVVSIGVSWGYGTPSELAGADVVIDRMADLHRVLTSMGRFIYTTAGKILTQYHNRPDDRPYFVDLADFAGERCSDAGQLIADELGLRGRGLEIQLVTQNGKDRLDPGRFGINSIILHYDCSG